MKLFRHGAPGAERPGLIDAEGQRRNLADHVSDLAGDVLTQGGLDRLRRIDPATLPPVEPGARLGPPISGIGKIVCVGKNYLAHAQETGEEAPSEPLVFMKATSALAGPNDDLILPPEALKTDWEVELAVVIGQQAKRIGEAEALAHVAGYTILNDISERAWQIEREGQFVKGKSHDGFAPLGPVLVTADEVADPQALDLWLEVDGHRYQNGNTRDMVFGIAHIISYLSHFMTLHPGDVIATGTPPGVGLGIKPEPVYLKPGQTMRLGIQGLGEQSQKVVAAA